MNRFLDLAQQLFPYSQRIRRDLHRFPELGFQEYRTAGVIARELGNIGLEVTTGVAQTGVIAEIEGRRPEPVLMMRFDMDALPIVEETNAEYASQNPGVMHACGHDGHVAIGLSVAHLLNEMRNELNGTVRLIFQPAEEGLGGAERMIAEGALGEIPPQFALGLHVWNEKPLGWLGIASGPMMAAAEIFEVEIIGSGGHGALPHLAVDPINAAAQIVVALNAIVARNVSPLQSAAVSVTLIHGGETFNVIPSKVRLQGTIRTFDPEARSTVLERFEQIVNGVALSARCKANINLKSLTPAVVNEAGITQKVIVSARRILPDSIILTDFRTMGSEDMAFFLNKVPGCFIFIGSANPAKKLDAPHHHPRFDFDEEVLAQAAALLTGAAIDLLS